MYSNANSIVISCTFQSRGRCLGCMTGLDIHRNPNCLHKTRGSSGFHKHTTVFHDAFCRVSKIAETILRELYFHQDVGSCSLLYHPDKTCLNMMRLLIPAYQQFCSMPCS